jgi:hypothetical protein
MGRRVFEGAFLPYFFRFSPGTADAKEITDSLAKRYKDVSVLVRQGRPGRRFPPGLSVSRTARALFARRRRPFALNDKENGHGHILPDDASEGS